MREERKMKEGQGRDLFPQLSAAALLMRTLTGATGKSEGTKGVNGSAGGGLWTWIPSH